MSNVREALVEMNPWWTGEFTADYRERELHAALQSFLPRPQIMSLTGLRRVGKTTLLMRLVEDAIRSGTDRHSVVYFTFDEFADVDLREVLREYENLTGQTIASGRHVVLFDEIQKFEGWEGQLKALYDRHKGRVKFIISGSESLFIRRRSKETLAGRLFDFRVEPLTFREFLGFKGVEFEPIALHEREIARLLDEFTETLGFPELVGVRDRQFVRKYVRESVIERAVYRDLPGLVSIRDPNLLSSLLNIISDEPGQLMQLRDLSSDLGVSRQTVANYLWILEEAFLLRKLYNYAPSRRKVERKLKKYYPTVVSTDLLFKHDDLSRSRVLEWLVVTQSRAEFFWRDAYKHEVDAVLGEAAPVPVEVKQGRVDLTGLKAFLRKFKATDGYVVTRDTEERHEIGSVPITVLPAHKFLLDATLRRSPT